MTEHRKTRTETLTVRLTPERREKLKRAQSALPYPITATAILERGLDLAMLELESLAERGSEQP